MAETKERAKTGRRRSKKTAATPRSRGTEPEQLTTGAPPAALIKERDAIEAIGGAVIGAYRDPLGGNWQLLAGLPIDVVEPTPYQRDLSGASCRPARGGDGSTRPIRRSDRRRAVG